MSFLHASYGIIINEKGVARTDQVVQVSHSHPSVTCGPVLIDKDDHYAYCYTVCIACLVLALGGGPDGCQAGLRIVPRTQVVEPKVHFLLQYSVCRAVRFVLIVFAYCCKAGR
jgi:hypothetical protein